MLLSARDPNDTPWLTLRYQSDVTPWPGAASAFGPRLEATLGYDANAGVLELQAVRPAREQRPLPGLAVQPDGERYRSDACHGVVIERCLPVSAPSTSSAGNPSAFAPSPCDPPAGTTPPYGAPTPPCGAQSSSDRDAGCGALGPVPLVCGHQWREPLGMALDRRGFLYVCDRGARAVLVIAPEDGAIHARLELPAMREPVDVAVAPDGMIYVADRGGGDPLGRRSGAIQVFDARFTPKARWQVRNDLGQPEPFRPIALWIEADGTLMVADAGYPRLLRVDAGGEVIGEAELRDLARPLMETAGNIQRLEDLYGDGPLRRIVGACCRGGLADELGVGLAAVHRALRLLQLRLSRRFATSGAWTTRILDAGVPGAQWHRLDLDADIPAGCTVVLESVSSDDRDALAGARLDALALVPDELPLIELDEDVAAITAAPHWDAVRDRDGHVLAFTGEELPTDDGTIRYDARRAGATLRELLVPSMPGRFLRVRVRFASDGNDTPQLRALTVRGPRNGYDLLLPAVFRRDPGAADFLSRYLSLFERTFTGIETVAERFIAELDPAASSREVIDWLGCLVDLAFDPSWDLRKRRALVGAAMALWRARGRPDGIVRYIEIYTGVRPVIIEAFLQRPGIAVAGTGGGWLGGGLVLGIDAELSSSAASSATADDAYAHRFTVVLPIADGCALDLLLPVVERIVSANKPAHTVHTIRTVRAGGRLELESALGVDLVLGGLLPEASRVADPIRGTPGAVLGVDAVLGEARRSVGRPPDVLL